jgi:hypothetical protein
MRNACLRAHHTSPARSYCRSETRSSSSTHRDTTDSIVQLFKAHPSVFIT